MLAPSATFEVELGGSDNSDPLNPQFDALHAVGAASLAGTLRVSLIDIFVPTTPDPTFGGDDDSFTILTANPISGAFDSVEGLDYDNVVETGRLLRLLQTSSDVTLTAFQAVYGDGNMDRQVDSTDLFAILGAGKFNARPSNATWIEGDLNGDDQVDSDDVFLILGAGQFNQGPYTSARVATQIVPEPPAFVSAVLSLLGLLVYLAGHHAKSRHGESHAFSSYVPPSR